jgi:hypothetical protein
MTSDNIGQYIVGIPVAVVLFLWLLVAVVASLVAPDDRRWTFFWITLFFLGPLGIAAAAIAQPRTPLYVALASRPRAKERQRHVCPRCGADSDLPKGAVAFDCWRCSEHVELEAPQAFQAPKEPWWSFMEGPGFRFGRR